MTGALIAAALGAGACAYLIGYAFVAPRESFLRSVTGGIVLSGCLLVALFLPSGLASIVAAGAEPHLVGSNVGAYRALWIALVGAGLLAGLRVWRMRRPSADGGFFRLDESPVGRAESQLPLADSFEEALEVLSREKVAPRDVARLAGALRRVGSRFFHQLPEKSGDLYALVARHTPPAVAADVTGLILEGAGRKRSELRPR